MDPYAMKMEREKKRKKKFVFYVLQEINPSVKIMWIEFSRISSSKIHIS